MEIPKKKENESLSEYSARLSELYNNSTNKDAKKNKGQFFTPLTVAKYMATLVEVNKSSVSILDPGAGIGVLSAALLEELSLKSNIRKINLVTYETDKNVLPFLRKVLEEAELSLTLKNIMFKCVIREADFVSSNSSAMMIDLSIIDGFRLPSFDVIISNPPYFKLNKKELQIVKFNDVISGQPNMYTLFMAISAKMLNNEGQMIFITPRSFCSGLYYSKFRKWLIEQVNFSQIHLFDSRKELFSSENVLQENIITKFSKAKADSIIITKTHNGSFSNMHRIVVPREDVIYKSNGHVFFRIPSSEEELNVIRTLDRLPYNFYKLGIKVSTGKVVAFRNRAYLKDKIGENAVPLFWMHNIKNGRVAWPLSKKGKPEAIVVNKKTKKLLLKASNYLMLKRFTTKEQKRRFEIGLIFKEDFEKYGFFALDNMTNYIYNPQKMLTKNQINGIANYLSLPIVDSYFRILNGHTQVNANEIYALPFPSLQELERLGDISTNVRLCFDKHNESVIDLNLSHSTQKELIAGI